MLDLYCMKQKQMKSSVLRLSGEAASAVAAIAERTGRSDSKTGSWLICFAADILFDQVSKEEGQAELHKLTEIRAVEKKAAAMVADVKRSYQK